MKLRSGTKKLSPVDSLNTTIFSDLPVEIKQTILNFLTLKEVLLFRVVSKDADTWIKDFDYLKRRLRRRRMNFDTKTGLNHFMNTMGTMPYTAFRFWFKLTEDEVLDQFKENYGSIIEELIVDEMGYCVEDAEYNFFQSLSSLRRLKIGGFTKGVQIVCRFESVSDNSEKEWQVPRIPSNCLKNLNSLEIHNCNHTSYGYDLIHSCPNLTKLSLIPILHPKLNNKKKTYDRRFLCEMVKYLTNRNKQLPLMIVFDTRDNSGVNFMHCAQLARDFIRLVGNSKIELFSVDRTILTYLHMNRNKFTKQEVSNFLNSVRSTLKRSNTFKGLGWNLSLKLSYWANQGVHSYLHNWDLPLQDYAMNNIKCIQFNIRFKPHQVPIEQILPVVRNIFENSRPTIKKLVVTEQRKSDSAETNLLITPEHLSLNFASLDTLVFVCSKFQHAEYTRLFHLLGEHTKVRNLRWRVLKDYDNFTLPATILEMKCLRTLHISVYKGVTRSEWTNAEFIDILSKIPLTEFILRRYNDSRPNAPCLMHQVTSRGLNSLKSGEFWNTYSLCVLGVYGKCCSKKPSIRKAMKTIKRRFTAKDVQRAVSQLV